MTSHTSPPIDTRQADELLADLLARSGGYVPEWQPAAGDAGFALALIAARYGQTILQRLNQASDKNKLAYLDLLGVRLIPAQPSRAPVIFRLAENAENLRIPAGTRLAVPPLPDRNDQIIFETENSSGMAVARLREVVSLWPGRDQYIDHSQAFNDGLPVLPFKKSLLIETPHILYLSHERLLALSGEVNVDVNFNLTTAGSEHLDLLWEYWDGKVWREFLLMRPECDDEVAARLDTTYGLTRSGIFRLTAGCAESDTTTVNDVAGRWIRVRLVEPLPPDPTQILPEVDSLTLSVSIKRPLILKNSATEVAIEAFGQRVSSSGDPFVFQFFSEDVELEPEIEEHLEDYIEVVEGLSPDAAVSDGIAVNLTQPFYPFGTTPQPGASFYFSSDEAFTKPGATVVIFVKRTHTPSDQLFPFGNGAGVAVAGKTRLQHLVRWEYWDGGQWKNLLPPYMNDSDDDTTADPKDFNLTGLVTFTMPDDLEKTVVNGEEAAWMRVRLVSGGYGFTQTIPLVAGGGDFNIVISQPPALSEFIMGYSWVDGPYHPERVFAYNDFSYDDRTEAAKWEGQTFQPFTPIRETTPALYLGFDQKLPVDRLGMYFDVQETRGDTLGPSLLWEFWNGFDWQNLPEEDETRNLRVPGMLSLIGPEESQPLKRFTASLHWLRARLKEDGPPGDPVINGLYPNAVWASQIQTIIDQPLGTSTGQPNQVFQFVQFPILEGEHVELRELAGLRANVEWRILAMEVYDGDARRLQEAETLLLRDDPQQDIQLGDLRLRRDRSKRVTEVWVRWRSQPTLLFSGPSSRDYALDRARGRMIFGDNEQGKAPPAGAAILVRRCRSGGGLFGNVGARKLSQVLAPIAGIEEVFNPIPASGGADGERPEALLERGPQTLRRRGRSLSVRDFETIAREASASVAFARALPCCNTAGITLPGWVTLVIIPQGGEPRPYPSFGLREHVRKFIEREAAASLLAGVQIHVTGPDYRPVDVEVVIAPVVFSEAGAVEQRARQALETFLHPLTGGPSARGWEPGRDVHRSDISTVLERVEGVDYIAELFLLIDGGLQGERVRIAAGQTVVAGQIRIKMIQREAS